MKKVLLIVLLVSSMFAKSGEIDPYCQDNNRNYKRGYFQGYEWDYRTGITIYYYSKSQEVYNLGKSSYLNGKELVKRSFKTKEKKQCQINTYNYFENNVLVNSETLEENCFDVRLDLETCVIF